MFLVSWRTAWPRASRRFVVGAVWAAKLVHPADGMAARCFSGASFAVCAQAGNWRFCCCQYRAWGGFCDGVDCTSSGWLAPAAWRDCWTGLRDRKKETAPEGAVSIASPAVISGRVQTPRQGSLTPCFRRARPRYPFPSWRCGRRPWPSSASVGSRPGCLRRC